MRHLKKKRGAIVKSVKEANPNKESHEKVDSGYYSQANETADNTNEA